MLVTYSLTIRRLQLEAAKCYTDPDDQLVIKTPISERLRRHRSGSKRIAATPKKKNSPSNELSLPTSPTIPDDKTNQLPWP